MKLIEGRGGRGVGRGRHLRSVNRPSIVYRKDELYRRFSPLRKLGDVLASTLGIRERANIAVEDGCREQAERKGWRGEGGRGGGGHKMKRTQTI
jgi:hypothetical protein